MINCMSTGYIETFPIEENISSEVLGTSRSTEVRMLGDKYVLKELSKVNKIKRISDESDPEYRSRRTKESLDILREEKELSEIAIDFIPKQIQTYPEFYLIANGSDGYPTPFKVQCLSKGQTLRDSKTRDLSPKLKSAMDELVAASVKCFFKTGKVFDIVGCTRNDDENPIGEVIRHLNPLKYSSNLLLIDDEKLAFIDARVGGGNLAKQIVSLLTLSGYYWNKLMSKIHG